MQNAPWHLDSCCSIDYQCCLLGLTVGFGRKMGGSRGKRPPIVKQIMEEKAACHGLDISSKSMPSSSRACVRITSFLDSCTATCRRIDHQSIAAFSRHSNLAAECSTC